jgi:hypothetical protein
MNDQTFGPGVFSRSHLQHVRKAHGKRMYFRSKVRWAGAARLLADKGAAAIYFAPIGGDGRVHYAGRLVDVLLDPTEESVARMVERTGARDVARGKEGLWDGTCQTVYVVEIEQLQNPFPMTDLRRLDGGEPLSADYGYAYSLVTRPAP